MQHNRLVYIEHVCMKHEMALCDNTFMQPSWLLVIATCLVLRLQFTFFKNYKLVHYFWPLLEWVNGYNFYFCFLCHSQIHICAQWNNTVFINVRNHKQEAIKVKYYENNHLSILLVTIISISVKIVIHWFGNTKLIQMSPATEVLEENWICLLNELVL